GGARAPARRESRPDRGEFGGAVSLGGRARAPACLVASAARTRRHADHRRHHPARRRRAERRRRAPALRGPQRLPPGGARRPRPHRGVALSQAAQPDRDRAIHGGAVHAAARRRRLQGGAACAQHGAQSRAHDLPRDGGVAFQRELCFFPESLWLLVQFPLTLNPLSSWPGLSRPSTSLCRQKTWMPVTSAGMTVERTEQSNWSCFSATQPPWSLICLGALSNSQPSIN